MRNIVIIDHLWVQRLKLYPHFFFGRQLLKTTCRDTTPLCARRWHQHPAKEGQLEPFIAQMVIG